MNTQTRGNDSINGYVREFQRALEGTPPEAIQATVECLFRAWTTDNQVFILGNGGSASTASHMGNDFSKATIVAGKRRMRVISLTDNVALMTAWGNDSSFDVIFSEQLENLLNAGDVVVAISASGNSPNVLRAMEFARRTGAVTIAWTGRSGGRVKDLADHCLRVPSDDVGLIEGVHLVIDHIVTGELRRAIDASDVRVADDLPATAGARA
jgi:D-sedoheptulose 7-phosphate isomerase